MTADLSDPAERLLAGAPLGPVEKLLVLEGGSGALLAGSARNAREIHFHNSDFLSHAKAQAHASPGMVRFVLGDLPRLAGSLPPDELWPDALEYPAGSFDAILYRLGKGTAALHGAVRIAWDLLREGGSLFLAGHTREGIKSLAQHAEGHFGNAELLALKSSCRLLRFRKAGSAPLDPIPDPGYHKPVHLTLPMPGRPPIPYLSKPGVFSYRSTDAGTALLAGVLASRVQDMAGRRILDLGCGAGPLSLAALLLGAREVVAVDSNAAAVSATKRNAQEAAITLQAHCSNLIDNALGDFDTILSNPPFHQGSDTDYGFPARVLEAALPRLAPGGRMILVANQFLDYPAQAKRLGASCETAAHEKGYKVHILTPVPAP